jgi:hypothetical protein
VEKSRARQNQVFRLWLKMLVRPAGLASLSLDGLTSEDAINHIHEFGAFDQSHARVSSSVWQSASKLALFPLEHIECDQIQRVKQMR